MKIIPYFIEGEKFYLMDAEFANAILGIEPYLSKAMKADLKELEKAMPKPKSKYKGKDLTQMSEIELIEEYIEISKRVDCFTEKDVERATQIEKIADARYFRGGEKDSIDYMAEANGFVLQ